MKSEALRLLVKGTALFILREKLTVSLLSVHLLNFDFRTGDSLLGGSQRREGGRRGGGGGGEMEGRKGRGQREEREREREREITSFFLTSHK